MKKNHQWPIFRIPNIHGYHSNFVSLGVRVCTCSLSKRLLTPPLKFYHPCLSETALRKSRTESSCEYFKKISTPSVLVTGLKLKKNNLELVELQSVIHCTELSHDKGYTNVHRRRLGEGGSGGGEGVADFSALPKLRLSPWP